MALGRVRDQASSVTTSGQARRLAGLLLASAILLADYLVVRATGGTPNPLVHFAYLGIILAAVAAGPAGGVAGGLIAGLMLGPLMPDSTAASHTFLGHWGWSFRLGAYIAAGLLVAAAWRWAQQIGRIDIRRREAREIVNLAAGEPTSLAACQRLLGELAHLRPIVAAAIYVLEGDGAYLLAGWNTPGLEINRRGYQIGAAAQRLREEAQGVPHRRAFEAFVLPTSAGDRVLARGGQSELVIPLQTGEVAVGVLYAIETGPAEPLDADLFHGLLELGTGAAALVRRAQRDEHAAAQRAADLVRAVLEAPTSLTPVFQPILSMTGGGVAGYEALARFPGDPPEPPHVWFERATLAGLGPDLQALAIQRARSVAAEARLPAGSFLTVNVSPGLLGHDAIRAVLAGDLRQVVIEMTEEEAVRDYATLRVVMAEYRARGARFAVDDAGAGYASMRHVTELRPEFVKLDARLITGISHDDARQALVRAMQSFTADIGATLIAEGVETDDELRVLAATGIQLLAQGFAIARPAPPWASVAPRARLAAEHPVASPRVRSQRLASAGSHRPR